MLNLTLKLLVRFSSNFGAQIGVKVKTFQRCGVNFLQYSTNFYKVFFNKSKCFPKYLKIVVLIVNKQQAVAN